jgi:hypothetical protein
LNCGLYSSSRANNRASSRVLKAGTRRWRTYAGSQRTDISPLNGCNLRGKIGKVIGSLLSFFLLGNLVAQPVFRTPNHHILHQQPEE